MNITVELHSNTVVIALKGELTVDESDKFRREIQETIEKSDVDVILDCAHLGLIDSVGLESLLWLADELNLKGKKLRLASISHTNKQVFELTRLDRVLSIHVDVEAAARSFS